MDETTHQHLAQSLPLARQWSKNLCRHVDDSGVSCRPFHTIWQVLRYLDINTTPSDHEDFFIAGMAPVIEAGARRILISGAADYAMLDVVWRSCAGVRVLPEITIVDICETPLRLCQWYADKMRIPVSVHCQDILTYRDEAPYDLICTHSFLGYFGAARRRQLVVRWHDLLAPGGLVLSINRLRPDASETTSFTSEEADTFVRNICERVAESTVATLFDPDEIADVARQYILHRAIHPVHSEAEISELFSAAGFHMQHLTSEPIASRHADSPSGPTLRGGARYAHFIVRRVD